MDGAVSFLRVEHVAAVRFLDDKLAVGANHQDLGHALRAESRPSYRPQVQSFYVDDRHFRLFFAYPGGCTTLSGSGWHQTTTWSLPMQPAAS